MDEINEVAAFKEKFGIDYIVGCYSDVGMRQLASMMSYRVEQAQFALLQEECEDLTWEEYLYYLSQSSQMQENARRAVFRAQRNFAPDQFDFENPEHGENRELVSIIRIFEENWVNAITVFFLFKAELEHHRRLCAEEGTVYSLKQYMRDLWEDKSLRAALRAGYEDAVQRLDFRKAWIEEGYGLTDDLFT